MVTGAISGSQSQTGSVNTAKIQSANSVSLAMSFQKIISLSGMPMLNGSKASKNNISVSNDMSSDFKDISQTSKSESIIKNASDGNEKLSELKNNLKDIVNEVKNTVKDKLDISEKELEDAMELLGLTIADLFNPQMLSSLIAEVKADGEAIAVVTDTDLSELFSELNTELKGMFDEISENFSVTSEKLFEELMIEADTSDSQKDVDKSQVMPGSEAVHEGRIDNKKNNDTSFGVRSESVDSTGNSESEIEISINNNSDKTGGDSPDKNSMGNQNETIAGQFLHNMTESVNQVIESDSSFSGYDVNATDVLRQIIDAVRVNISSENTTMQLDLHPEQLGKLMLTVASKDGVVTAQITAQNETVKEIIESQLTILRDNMNNQGVKVEAIEVTLASHGFEAGHNFENAGGEQQEEQNPKRTRRISIDAIGLDGEELTEDELIIREMMRANGNNVDYTA